MKLLKRYNLIAKINQTCQKHTYGLLNSLIFINNQFLTFRGPDMDLGWLVADRCCKEYPLSLYNSYNSQFVGPNSIGHISTYFLF